MEAIKRRGIARKGVLSLAVPKEFEDKELEVIILSSAGIEQNEKDIELNSREERNARLMGIVGTAKFPDFPINKFDVYDQ